jgi:hypothetical protein
MPETVRAGFVTRPLADAAEPPQRRAARRTQGRAVLLKVFASTRFRA